MAPGDLFDAAQIDIVQRSSVATSDGSRRLLRRTPRHSEGSFPPTVLLSTKLRFLSPYLTRTAARLAGVGQPRRSIGQARTVPRPPARPAEVLSQADMHRYADQGFLALPNLCDAAELTLIRTTLRELFERRAGRNEGTQFDMLGLDAEGTEARQPQIVKPSVFAPALLRTAYFGRLLAAARQLLGDDAQFSFDHSILKPAGSAASTPWHQDEAHHKHKYLRFRQVSFWMPLQDTPLEMGCMRYIPRSDRGPLLPHGWLDGDPRIHALECSTDNFDESSAVAEPAAAGSCVLHDGRTLHSALPNVSAEDRLAYIVAFTAPAELSRNTPPVTLAPNATAKQRRRAWLLRGGFLIYGLRRLRQGLRSNPRSLWLKLRMLARVHLRAHAPPRNHETLHDERRDADPQ